MKGSILDADHPDMGVNFARRSTRLLKKSMIADGGDDE